MNIEFTCGNKTYTLSRPSSTIMEKFITWAKTQLPDPMIEVKELYKDFPLEIQKDMVRHAVQQRSLRDSGQSDDIQGLMATPKGARKILGFLIKESLTDKEIEDLIVKTEDEHGVKYLLEKLKECISGKKPESASVRKITLSQDTQED